MTHWAMQSHLGTVASIRQAKLRMTRRVVRCLNHNVGMTYQGLSNHVSR